MFSRLSAKLELPVFFIMISTIILSLTKHRIVSSNARIFTNLNALFTQTKSSRFDKKEMQVSKLFNSTENDYYHSYLRKNKKYSNTIAFLDYVNDQKPDNDILSVMKANFEEKNSTTLVSYLHTILLHYEQAPQTLNNPVFIKLCEAICKKINEFNNDQALNLLKVLTIWENKRDSRFYELCKVVDDYIVRDYKIWGLDKLLYGMDHFYRLGVFKYSEFSWSAMKRIFREPRRLSSAQLIHALFLINAHRTWHPAIDMWKVTYHLESCVVELTTEELAIVALSYFKTQKKMRDQYIIELMYSRLYARAADIDSIPLSSFLKFFRFVSLPSHAEKIRSTLKILCPHINKHYYFSCTHLVLLGTCIHEWYPEAFQVVAERFVKEISSIRIKDIEKTIFAFQLFNFEPRMETNLYELAYQEIERRLESGQDYRFPKPFLGAVHYLCLRGYFNYKVINVVLSKEFLLNAIGFREITPFNCHPSMLFISESVRIECPDYTGNLLDTKIMNGLYKAAAFKIAKQNEKRISLYVSIMLDVLDLLWKILGDPEFAHLTAVLPHLSRADILLCLKDGKPVKLPKHILNNNYLEPGLPSTTEDWCVITFSGWNTVILNTTVPTGTLNAKIRQLKKVGYRVTCLSQEEWLKCSSEEKVSYLYWLIKKASFWLI